MTNNNPITFRHDALAMIEALLYTLNTSNALDGRHAHQVGGTFGAIYDALKVAIACEVWEEGTRTFEECTAIATCLRDEAIDNGENIAWQVDLFNKGIIAPA